MREGQIKAMFTSTLDQFAIATLSQVGSVDDAAIRRACSLRIEIMQTLDLLAFIIVDRSLGQLTRNPTQRRYTIRTSVFLAKARF